MSQSDSPAEGASATGQRARVADAMRHGVVSCFVDASLHEAARTMALHRVHALVVTNADGSLAGVLSDIGLLGGLLDPGGPDNTAGEVADREPATISSDDTVADAARLMRERGTSHLLVRDARSGRPSGMLSTLDVAGMLAGPEPA
jgi:CBS domain-containing protein